MTFSKISILLGAIWCAFSLVISLLGGAVVLFCTSADIPQCGDSGVEVARQWRPVAAYSIAIFGAGAFFGFRTLAPELRVFAIRLFRVFRRGNIRG